MPVYEYRCKCGNERQVRLSFADGDRPQICECKESMRRKVSLSSHVMKPTGVGMALDTLNAKTGGLPDKHWKADAERFAAAGL